MRKLLVALFAALLIVPAVQAEWGEYGSDGWPVAVDGTSTNPFAGTSGAQPDTSTFGTQGPAAEPLNQVQGTTIYPYWPILTAEVQRLASEFPTLVKLHSAGKSSLGLDLWMLEICNFAADPNPADDDRCPAPDGGKRESVWVDGGTHSNEYSGVYFALHLADWLVEGYGANANATWIVENRHTWIMPMVNPDGSNLMGRLNAHLVNINRNYPVIWDGQGHDAFLNNRGPSPASEVETQINIEWFNKTRPDYYASVHCCGNLWLYPYGEEGVDPIDQVMLSKVCDEAFAAVREACGPIWSTIYPASGSSVDTAYEYSGAVAFGYEMSGRGAVAIWGQPLTTESVEVQEVESWQGILHAFYNVHRYGAYPVVTDVAADHNGMYVTLRNDGLGNLSAGTATLHFPAGGSSQAAIPFLAPGEDVVILLACEEDGAHTLQLEYAKRLVATSNVGLINTPITLATGEGESGPMEAGGFQAYRLHGAGSEQSPGLPLFAMLAVLGAALLLRRRSA